MSEWKGMIVTCDRCGKETRREWLSEKEMDGGFTRIQNFEPIAEGWEYEPVIEGHLCPFCHDAFEQILDEFMNS